MSVSAADADDEEDANHSVDALVSRWLRRHVVYNINVIDAPQHCKYHKL